MADNQYQVSAWWTSGKGGIVRSDQVPTVIHFTAPVSFGGDPGRWTPEELMLAAIASCFTTTFRSIATYSKLDYTDLEVSVDGGIEKTASGFQFTAIRIKPKLTISNEDMRPLAEKVLHKSETLCLVGRALSTPKTFHPEVVIGVPLQPAVF
jgi:organic hydroperoxide reductase OsmC/OhrA